MTNTKKIIAIDAGKFNLKGKSDIGELIFNTKYSEHETDAELLGEKTYNVSYKGKKYTVGNNATIPDMNEGKDSEVHILSTLTAIALLRGEAKEIVLMYGESFNKYSNPDHKRRLKSLFEGEHTITVGSHTHTFTINLCHILPEGIGHILCDMETYKGVQYTVDWGGTTAIFIKTMNGRPDMDISASFHLGMHNINAIVSRELIKAGIGRYDMDMIGEWIQNGCDFNSDIQRIIDETVKQQLLKIDKELSGFGINLHVYQQGITFIGGTSQLFQSHIRKHYKYSNIHKNCLKANVNGFYEYGVAKYGR